MKKYRNVDDFITTQTKWKEAMIRLRELCLSSGMEETIKWGMPTYGINGKNVAGLGSFKHHFGIWFFNGALLEDKDGILENAQSGKTQAMRQIKFKSIDEINPEQITRYLKEAANNQKSGKVVKLEKRKRLEPPAYFMDALSSKAKKIFNGFTPAKQNDYVEWVTEAKTEATRKKRITQSNEWLEEGKPRNWKYMKEWKK